MAGVQGARALFPVQGQGLAAAGEVAAERQAWDAEAGKAEEGGEVKPRKPVLSERVLRGILEIESVCGGMLDRSEMSSQGLAPSQWDDAKAAQEWARAMLAYRKAARATR